MEKKRDDKVGPALLWDRIIEGMPLFAKELIAGGAAGGIAKTAVAPLERIKILFQARLLELGVVQLIQLGV